MTPRRLLVGMAAVVVAAGAAWSLLRPSTDVPTRQAVDRFFDRYVTDEGRVRRDEGDTVSEGQAYALLMAVATDNRRRFHRVWEWTRTHLLRPDGAMAWSWDGGVVDDGIAPDADVDAAVALYMAARRFDRPSYARAAGQMAETVLEQVTVPVAGRRHLSAGTWAADGGGTVLNPSYLDPASFRFLAEKTGDGRWASLAEAARRLLAGLLRNGLPPDWVVLADDGSVRPIASPDERSGPGQFGFDALRVPIRLATECTAGLSQAMGPVWPEMSQHPGAAVRSRAGRPAVDWNHPAGFVATAAMAQTFQPGEVDDLLGRAAASDRRHPSYYGAAWVALGRLMLTTSNLERCL